MSVCLKKKKKSIYIILPTPEPYQTKSTQPVFLTLALVPPERTDDWTTVVTGAVYAVQQAPSHKQR